MTASSTCFITLHPNAVMRVNNGVLMRDAAIAGLGIAVLPALFLNESLQKRTLRHRYRRRSGRRNDLCCISGTSALVWKDSRRGGVVTEVFFARRFSHPAGV